MSGATRAFVPARGARLRFSPMRSAAGLLLLSLALPACASSREVVEARSLLGAPLVRPALAPEDEARLTADLEQARAAWEAQPDSEEAAIWVGRRLGYLGRYREAIAWYGQSLERHPASYRLLRHRGHRLLNVRRLGEAARDLERAAELMHAAPDAWEPDGIPNRIGVPRGTDRFNVLYHLGLAHYLRGEDARAIDAYRACLEVAAANGDMLCATSYWLVLALRRAGRDAEVAEVLAAIVPELDVVENEGYRDLLLAFRGTGDLEELLVRHPPGTLEHATLAYGAAAWFLAEGRRERALEVLEELVAGPFWPAFGYLAAEADLARLPGGS